MNNKKSPWRKGRTNKTTKTPKGNNYTYGDKPCEDCDVMFIPTSGTQRYCKKCKSIRYADNFMDHMGDNIYSTEIKELDI